MKKLFLYLLLTLFTIGTFFISLKVVEVKASVYPFNGMLVGDASVIHITPDTYSSSAVTELAYGTRVKVVGEDGNMYKIEYDNGVIGYVAKSLTLNVDSQTLTSSVDGIENYSDYCTMLGQKGFPESYCPYLYYLHSKYPKWNFDVDKIGMTLDYVSNQEQWKNVLQTANQNYWLSSSPIEGNYYYVKTNVIASFMDPRNSLFEKYIFQFLDLQQSKDIYNDASMLSITGSNNLSKYITYYAQAGVQRGVNPLHMLARSSQEGMGNATYGSVSGTYSTTKGWYTPSGHSVDGFYNFFNVGAWEAEGYTTVGRGLSYAAGYLEKEECLTLNETDQRYYYDEAKCGVLSDMRPWNTPEKAILGGSYFLADKYVKIGQDSLFYQKFNIGSSIAREKLFTHQYMTNIYAPVSEGSKMYNAYNTGSLLGSEFSFKIPVYDDMGDVYQPIDKDGETRLSEIKINNELITGFDKDVEEYSINVVTEDEKISVTAITMSAKTQLTGIGEYTFVDGVTTIELTTTAEDGSVKKYIISVKQVLPENKITVNDIVSQMAVKVTDNIMYGISPGLQVNTLINTVVTSKGTAKVYDVNGNEKVNGLLATGDKIIINGTSDEATYYIAVRGDVTGDGVIKINDLILIQSHILEKRMTEGVYFYAADVNYDGSVKINDLILVQSHILEKGNL